MANFREKLNVNRFYRKLVKKKTNFNQHNSMMTFSFHILLFLDNLDRSKQKCLKYVAYRYYSVCRIFHMNQKVNFLGKRWPRSHSAVIQ